MSHRIIYSGWDFQQALSALTFLCDECEFDGNYSRIDLRRFRCFETTMIVSFARPFKAGRGREPLDLSKIGFSITEEESKLKDRMLWLRDKVISHSDEEEMEYKTYLIKPFDDHDIVFPAEQFIESLYLSGIEYSNIEKFLRRILHAIAQYKFDFAQSHPTKFEQTKESVSRIQSIRSS